MTRTLLVVDDNNSVRESLRFLLGRRGYIVLLAESGERALELARTNSIDGAMIDVQMPGMNGLEVCRVLAAPAVSEARRIPIWMMTGCPSPAVTRLSAEAGALALLGKPFDLPDLYRRFDQQFGEEPVAPVQGGTGPLPAPPEPPAAASA